MRHNRIPNSIQLIYHDCKHWASAEVIYLSTALHSLGNIVIFIAFYLIHNKVFFMESRILRFLLLLRDNWAERCTAKDSTQNPSSIPFQCAMFFLYNGLFAQQSRNRKNHATGAVVACRFCNFYNWKAGFTVVRFRA